MIFRVLLVVAIQTVALAYMIVDRQAMLNAAQTVTLKVVPVDPTDMFRGDYVILRYDISTLDPAKLEGEDTFNYGDKVYVTLAPGDTWTATAIARTKPVAPSGGAVISGTVESILSPSPAIGPDGQPQPETTPQIQTVTVGFGIESFFVPEGTGRAIEDEARKGDLRVDVALDKDGRAAIKAIRRNNETIYVEGIF